MSSNEQQEIRRRFVWLNQTAVTIATAMNLPVDDVEKYLAHGSPTERLEE